MVILFYTKVYTIVEGKSMEKEENQKEKQQVEEIEKKEEIAKEQEEKKEEIETQQEEIKEELNKKNEETKEEVREEKTKKHTEKKKLVIGISIAVIILVIMFFSVIFSLCNINNNKILKGISILGIEVGGLSIDEAQEQIRDAIESRFNDENNNLILKREIEKERSEEK